MPGTITDHLLQVIERYDSQIRSNRGPGWDTLQAVADCDDGLYGAWGEVLEEGCRMLPTILDWENTGRQVFVDNFTHEDLLQLAYQAWRIGLQGQVAAEAAHRAWREQT